MVASPCIFFDFFFFPSLSPRSVACRRGERDNALVPPLS